MAATAGARAAIGITASVSRATSQTPAPNAVHIRRYAPMNIALRSSVDIRAGLVTPRRCRRIIGIAEGNIIAAIISVQEPRNGASAAPNLLRTILNVTGGVDSGRIE